ncbi:LysM peptidoglycan-binding domain-containing protein [Paenisporosarcina macmurdoensis]|uniref:LysM peptidoglycan-binding domain-containing protein n=1 Tax=Paenisporosarcina macmurdoensis TaxID=212659 RepID=A0ABW1L6G9_9BACL
MNNDDYQNKIEEYRKPIKINDEEPKPNTRTSRRSTAAAPKKTKQKRNLLLPILFFFFILIPVSFLIYVFAFYQPNANETTVYDNSEVQYEQNDEDTTTETDGENTAPDSEENTDTETPVESTEPEEQPVEEKPVEEPVEEAPVEAPVEEKPVEQPIEEPVEEPSSGKTHIVQPGETLYRIAMNYYNSPDAVEKIKSANGLSSNSISTGQTLILP